MIQIISNRYNIKNIYNDNKKFIVSKFESPKSFDQYDINVIDLGFDEFWENQGTLCDKVNLILDFVHYLKMIETSEISQIIVVFPQNLKYRYNYSEYSGNYKNYRDLKNLNGLVVKLIRENINETFFELDFENTVTKLLDKEVLADFYFNENYLENDDILLRSEKSNKVTTIKVDTNLYYTTLNLIEDSNVLEDFLVKIKVLNKNKEEIPSWINDINILDDDKIKKNIDELEDIIKKKQENKEKELEKLKINNKIKSILYETGTELQNEVIEILNEILDYRDDNFVDEMEEDFRIKKTDVTFIIETKGLSRNIKGTDVNKTVNHVLVYEEEHPDSHENLKGIFIVATQREKELSKREELPDRQIQIAERNNILIVTTVELLKVLDAFRNNKITTDEIIEELKNKNGEYKFEK